MAEEGWWLAERYGMRGAGGGRRGHASRIPHHTTIRSPLSTISTNSEAAYQSRAYA